MIVIILFLNYEIWSIIVYIVFQGIYIQMKMCLDNFKHSPTWSNSLMLFCKKYKSNFIFKIIPYWKSL